MTLLSNQRKLDLVSRSASDELKVPFQQLKLQLIAFEKRTGDVETKIYKENKQIMKRINDLESNLKKDRLEMKRQEKAVLELKKLYQSGEIKDTNNKRQQESPRPSAESPTKKKPRKEDRVKKSSLEISKSPPPKVLPPAKKVDNDDIAKPAVNEAISLAKIVAKLQKKMDKMKKDQEKSNKELLEHNQIISETNQDLTKQNVSLTKRLNKLMQERMNNKERKTLADEESEDEDPSDLLHSSPFVPTNDVREDEGTGFDSDSSKDSSKESKEEMDE